MAPILIVYGTTEGQTEKIARILAQNLREEGAEVDVMNAAHDPGLHPEDFRAIIVAASLHAGKYQKPVRRWVQANVETLRTRQSAFPSVCLGVFDPRRSRRRADVPSRRTVRRSCAKDSAERSASRVETPKARRPFAACRAAWLTRGRPGGGWGG